MYGWNTSPSFLLDGPFFKLLAVRFREGNFDRSFLRPRPFIRKWLNFRSLTQRPATLWIAEKRSRINGRVNMKGGMVLWWVTLGLGSMESMSSSTIKLQEFSWQRPWSEIWIYLYLICILFVFPKHVFQFPCLLWCAFFVCCSAWHLPSIFHFAFLYLTNLFWNQCTWNLGHFQGYKIMFVSRIPEYKQNTKDIPK